MWILILIAIGALYLIVTRSVFLNHSANLNAPLFMNHIMRFLMDKKPDEAVKLCDAAGRRALPWIVKGAILKAEIDPRGVRTLIEERTVSIIPRLQKHLMYLATLGNISTMVGLMGTIYGLILSFNAVGSPDIDPSMKSSMLADGISAAMNTTLAGLVISVPCILAYTYFRDKVNNIIAYIDQHVISLIRILAPGEEIHKSYKPSERKTAQTADSEPNMVPIMGLMVVLIPLLLSSAEFVKIGRTTINLPQAAAPSEADEDEEEKILPKTLSLGLVINKKGISILHTLEDKKKGKKKKEKKEEETKEKEPDIPVLKDGTHDFETLNKKLVEVKTRVLASLLREKRIASFKALYRKFLKALKEKEFYDYKDLSNVKLLADNKTSYRTVISVMDAARNFVDKDGNKYSLFPVVSIGVMR
jgi:biopolymer transport protein ExbB/TolQ/biopolymer transport protein ExbD